MNEKNSFQLIHIQNIKKCGKKVCYTKVIHIIHIKRCELCELL